MDLDVPPLGVMETAAQDRKNAPVLNKSRCAVVASSDLVFGVSRMWEILSDDTGLTKMIFRDIEDAREWLGLRAGFLDSS